MSETENLDSGSESSTDDNPTFLRKKWVKNNIDIGGGQASAIHDAFATRRQLLDALEAGEDLTEYDGIGAKTESALWDWFNNVYNGRVETDGTLVLDDEGLHLPEWLVGFVGTFTVETPNITMRPKTTKSGLGEVSEMLKTYPDSSTWNARLSEGQIAMKTALNAERIYDIDDQRTEVEG